MKFPRCMGWTVGLGWGVLLLLGALSSAACQPGYIKADKLESRGQGPSACAKSCESMNMRMTAMVLVGDDIPGCVCQALVTEAATPPAQAAPAPALPPATVAPPQPPASPPAVSPPPAAPVPAQPQSANDAAAAATSTYVLVAAAAAVARHNHQRNAEQSQQAFHY